MQLIHKQYNKLMVCMYYISSTNCTKNNTPIETTNCIISSLSWNHHTLNSSVIIAILFTLYNKVTELNERDI